MSTFTVTGIIGGRRIELFTIPADYRLRCLDADWLAIQRHEPRDVQCRNDDTHQIIPPVSGGYHNQSFSRPA